MLTPLQRFEDQLRAKGLDLVHPFRRSWVDGDPDPNLPGAPEHLGLIVGNSKALWPRFLEGRRNEPNPLDHYVVRTIREAAAMLPWPCEVRFSFEGGARLVPIQHVAMRSGMAHLSPAQLCVHPVHGPWIGLRAVLICATEGPEAGSPAPDPCSSCDKPCMDALRAAMGEAERPTATSVRDWRRWGRVRQVCPVGADRAYGDNQLAYHHTHDPRLLK